MSLADAPMHRQMRVTAVKGEDSTSIRLMELGMIEGAQIAVLRRAPLGDPMQVRLGDYELSLRSRDAERVDVVPC